MSWQHVLGAFEEKVDRMLGQGDSEGVPQKSNCLESEWWVLFHLEKASIYQATCMDETP
jgi:hypothetical protein